MAKRMTEQFESAQAAPQAKACYYFRTGCTLLDHMIGGGEGEGSPAGRIIHFIGESSAGKTFFANETVAASYRKDKEKVKWVYDDAEHGYSFYSNSRKLWGIDIRKKDDITSSTVEELYYNLRTFLNGLKEDERGIYIVDSLDALMSDELEERAEERMKAGAKGERFDKGTYGAGSQKFLSQEFFRKLSKELEEHNSVLIFLSQMRDNLNAGPYGKKRRVSGGSALKFYCDTEIELKLREKFVKNGLHYGSCVEAVLEKSKTSRPDRSVLINILFDYGIDDISTNIDYVFGLKSDETGKLGKNLICNIGNIADPKFGKYEFTLDGVKSMMVDENLYDTAVEELKAQGQKRNKETYTAWMKEKHPEIFQAYFGNPVERDTLIQMAEEDKDLRKQIKQMALDKWEAREASISSGRTKYHDDDEY